VRGGGREWVVVDRDPTSNESFETLETFVPPGPPTLDPIDCCYYLEREGRRHPYAPHHELAWPPRSCDYRPSLTALGARLTHIVSRP